jgi:hypothetical protein
MLICRRIFFQQSKIVGGKMREILSVDEQIKQMMVRLEGMLGAGYEVKGDYIYRVETTQRKTLLGTKTDINKVRVAELNWYDEYDEEGSEFKHKIVVNDESIYPVMKQFGEEFGFEVLERNWPGADVSEKKPKPQRKMKEVVGDTMRPRYEKMVEGIDK